MAQSFNFLGTFLLQDLKWEDKITPIIKRAQKTALLPLTTKDAQTETSNSDPVLHSESILSAVPVRFSPASVQARGGTAVDYPDGREDNWP